MRRLALTIVSAAVLAGPVLAQPDTGATSSAAPAPQTAGASGPAKDRRICRSTVVTGSRLGKRKICRTAREWAAADIASQQSVREMQRTGGHNGGVHSTPRGPGNPSGSLSGGG